MLITRHLPMLSRALPQPRRRNHPIANHLTRPLILRRENILRNDEIWISLHRAVHRYHEFFKLLVLLGGESSDEHRDAFQRQAASVITIRQPFPFSGTAQDAICRGRFHWEADFFSSLSFFDQRRRMRAKFLLPTTMHHSPSGLQATCRPIKSFTDVWTTW